MIQAQQSTHDARGRVDDTAALRTRLLIVEAALRCIEHEADQAVADPQNVLATLCRISAIARQAAR